MAKLHRLTDEQALDRLEWLMDGYSDQQLRATVTYSGFVVNTDAGTVDTLREISNVARDLAFHYEQENLKNATSPSSDLAGQQS